LNCKNKNLIFYLQINTESIGIAAIAFAAIPFFKIFVVKVVLIGRLFQKLVGEKNTNKE
jgi:formate hydrogenlyase subunit 3/multisubunit Na+/H+ antiporter MnhD subunit